MFYLFNKALKPAAAILAETKIAHWVHHEDGCLKICRVIKPKLSQMTQFSPTNHSSTVHFVLCSLSIYLCFCLSVCLSVTLMLTK